MATISTRFKKYLSLIAMTASACMLLACGGGSSSTADTTPPSVTAFSVTNGASVTASSDASYAVSGNVGTTQQYTVTFSEKLGATSYSVNMLDANNAPVALPTGMTATLTANDSGNLTYTLTITTNGTFVFDAGQPSKAVKLQMSVADTATNTAKVNVTETVNHVDTVGVATITGPATSTGVVTLTLSANDPDGIASWELSYVRTRNSGNQDASVTIASGTGSPPSTYTAATLEFWGGGNKATYLLRIVDTFGIESTGTWTVTRN